MRGQVTLQALQPRRDALVLTYRRYLQVTTGQQGTEGQFFSIMTKRSLGFAKRKQYAHSRAYHLKSPRPLFMLANRTQKPDALRGARGGRDLVEARRLIEKHGYFRRIAELEAAEAALIQSLPSHS